MKLRNRNGHWYIWHSRSECPPSGKLVSIKSVLKKQVTKKEAEEFFRIYKQEDQKQRFASVLAISDGKILLSDLAELYTSGERADLAKDSLRMDGIAVRGLIESVGDKRVSAIRKNDLVIMKNNCLERGLSPASVKSYFRHLKAALAWAAKNNYIATPPEFPQVKAPQLLPQIIPGKHLAAIMAYAKKHNPEIWRYAHFALHTGCRITEVRNLLWQHVQSYPQPSPAGIVGRALLTGKGDKQRTVPLLPEAMEAAGEKKDIGPVFAQWIVSTTSKRFKECVRSAALDFKNADDFEAYHFHCLRHTAATNMLEKGLKIETIQKILGHTSLTTTQIYAHVLDDFIEEEMGKMISADKV